MKALLSHEVGGPEALKLTEIDDPTAGPGELLVRVKAAAVKPDEVAPDVDTGPSELDVLLEIRDALANR